MKQRKISDLIKELEEIKKTHGDLDVRVHLESMKDAHGGEWSYEDFDLFVQTITEVCPDTYKTLNKDWKILSLYGADFTPEDYK